MSRSPMPLEGYATMRAEMEAGIVRDDVLARAGIGVEEWAEAQHHWLDQMGGELERGRFELTNRYTQAFLARQRALETPAAIAAPALAPQTIAAPPSALPIEPAPSPPILAIPAAPPPLVAMPRPADRFGTTGSIDPAIIRAALPFAKDAPAPKPADSTSPAPSAPPTPAATPAPRREVPIGSSTGELPADLIARIAKGSLPFPAKPAVSAPAPSSPAPPKGDTPPAPSKGGPVTSLTIEQYAALCVELAASPQQTDAVFLRYGLTTARDRAEADRAWRERLGRDPAEYQRWQELYQRYQVYWREKARRGPAR